MLKFVLAATIAASTVAPAFAAEPIVGTWKRANGTLIKFSAKGSNKFCGTVLNGEFKGKSIGCLSGGGKAYKGKINKLDEDKVYTGKGEVSGKTLKLSGCVLFGTICKGENWKRQ